jgi:hypothetical protein
MDLGQLSQLFPLLVPIVGMLIPIIAIVMGIAAKMQREKLRHDTLRAFAERGQPVPPELLNPSVTPEFRYRHGRRTGLQVGAVNAGAGLGLMLMFYLMQPGGWLWSIGAIPLFVGVALLIATAVERKQAPPQA